MNPQRPIVFLTNDDGYDAKGLRALRAALGSDVTVFSLAPVDNHTCGSHRVTVGKRVTVTALPEVGTYSCSGTPADCVRIGVLGGLFPRPDLVVAGINHGANAGEDVHYSGTVAAAAEAAMLEVPALAVSQDGPEPGVPFLASTPPAFPGAELAANTVRALTSTTSMIPPDTLLSLNLPFTDNSMSLVPARVGRREWHRARLQSTGRDDVRTFDTWSNQPPAVAAPGTDFAALAEGKAALSMLSVRGGLHDQFDESLLNGVLSMIDTARSHP